MLVVASAKVVHTPYTLAAMLACIACLPVHVWPGPYCGAVVSSGRVFDKNGPLYYDYQLV